MKKEFACAISCMDGRIQNSVDEYIKQRTDREYVDVISLAGPVKVLAEQQKNGLLDNINFRLDISINVHKSNYVAVVGHHDCAAIKESDEQHKNYILEAKKYVEKMYPNILVEALWVDKDFCVHKLQ